MYTFTIKVGIYFDFDYANTMHGLLTILRRFTQNIMKNKLRILLLILIALPGVGIGQTAPTIGEDVSVFTLFTSNGALTGIGNPVITGTIGTNLGDQSGFNPSVDIERQNTATQLAAADLLNFSFDPAPEPCAVTATPLGNAQTLTKGVYCKADATIFSGDLTLDGQNEAGAVFVFQIGGAVTFEALARIVLINGATLDNVYFKVLGAVTLSAGSVFRGTIINTGAISLTGATLIGKALTIDGEITVNNSIVIGTEAALPVTLTSFDVKKGEFRNVILSWTTTAESNSDRFEIQNSKTGKQWSSVGVLKAGGQSSTLRSYHFNLDNQGNGINLYRLKMIDKDETFAYSRIRSLDFTDGVQAILYPNPAIDEIALQVNDITQVHRIQFTSVSGKSYYDKTRSASSPLTPNLQIGYWPAGLYVAKITLKNGDYTYHKIIKQ